MRAVARVCGHDKITMCDFCEQGKKSVKALVGMGEKAFAESNCTLLHDSLQISSPPQFAIFVASILLPRVTPIRVGPHSGSHNGPRLDSCLRSGDVYQSAMSSTRYGLGPAQMMILMTMNLVFVIIMVTTITTAELIIPGTSIMCRSNKL